MKVLQWLQEAKRIHGICPCCDVVFRLSDAQVFTTTAPPRTPFDRLQDARERHEKVITDFELVRDELLEQERLRGALAAHEQLKRIAPNFAGREIDPEDVKVLFDPIRYVVFRGMNNRAITAIELVDVPPQSAERERFVRSLEGAIQRGNIEWATWRVTDDGRVEVERVLH